MVASIKYVSTGFIFEFWGLEPQANSTFETI